MRINQFAVRNQRAVRLAACDSVPPLMLITGPNGSGKSTLLNALRSAGEGSGRTLYVGPHRNSRRQTVRMRFLGQTRIEMGSLLSAGSVPGLEGMNLPSHDRDAWNFDEAQSFLKYSLCQIEIERQNAITRRFDEQGSVSRSDLPDVWEPLRELAHNLLPHLRFHKIDLTNRDQIRCLWQVHSSDVHVDIDDLSSGEKAIIQLFFPLIEHRITRALAAAEPAQDQAPTSVAVLMDEPELHLHPNLQGKILDYMRGLCVREGAQFILATHSPAMVEHATNEELYLMRPAELLQGDVNQLVRVASDEDRLNALRTLFGSTSNVTALRTVLVVEGRGADKGSRRPADARIYGFLSDRFGQLTVISGGGKSECQALVRSLNGVLSSIAGNLKSVALLDRDTVQGGETQPDQVLLPVSMIENLLVDPESIFRAIQPVLHKTAFASPQDISAALDAILDAMSDHEVSRRVKAGVESRTFRVSDPVEAAREQVERFAQTLLTELSPELFAELVGRSRLTVEQLQLNRQRREHFDGKKILTEFFARHLHDSGMSREIFIHLCAKEASQRTSVGRFVDSLFKVLGVSGADSAA